MGTKKMGRPTDSPKEILVRGLIDDDTNQKLLESIELLQVSKAEVIRRGIHMVHEVATKK